MGKRELVALFVLPVSRVIVVRLYLMMPWVFLQFVIVELPDYTHLLFLWLFIQWTPLQANIKHDVTVPENNIEFNQLIRDSLI